MLSCHQQGKPMGCGRNPMGGHAPSGARCPWGGGSPWVQPMDNTKPMWLLQSFAWTQHLELQQPMRFPQPLVCPFSMGWPQTMGWSQTIAWPQRLGGGHNGGHIFGGRTPWPQPTQRPQPMVWLWLQHKTVVLVRCWAVQRRAAAVVQGTGSPETHREMWASLANWSPARARDPRAGKADGHMAWSRHARIAMNR